MEITWTFTDINEANSVLQVLGKVPLPYEQTAPLFERLKKQMLDQLSPPPRPAVEGDFYG